MVTTRFIKALIWAGFIALLAVSIPKFAWAVRSYEPATPLFFWNIDVLWIIPLFIASCIDALILAVSYAVTQDKERASKASMWVFVGTLCLISGYCNLLYNLDHMPSGGVWEHLFFAFVTPFVLSGVPLFALYYTFILSRLEGKGESFEEKAARLEYEREFKDRIQAANRGRLISRVGDTIKQVKEQVQTIKQPDQTSKQTAEQTEFTSLVSSNSEQTNKKQTVYSSLHINPELTVTELARQAGVTKGYASQLKTQFLSEQSKILSNGHIPLEEVHTS